MAKKYTAAEILEAVGADVGQIGQVAVRIAGVRGINTPDHKIAIQNGVNAVDVVVGQDSYQFNPEQ